MERTELNELFLTEMGFEIRKYAKYDNSNAINAEFSRVYDELFAFVKSNNILIFTESDLEKLLDSDEKKRYWRKAQAYLLAEQFFGTTDDIPEKSMRIIRDVLDLYRRDLFVK